VTEIAEVVRGGGRQGKSGTGRRTSESAHRGYPRTARLNESLREVLADALERLSDTDERLAMVTITGVECDPDLRRALVLFSSLDNQEASALGEARVRLQSVISQQVRLKRTPLLRFAEDPAVSAGARIDEILRDLPRTAEDHPPGEPPPPSASGGDT
jgi:ribosome-binding factor A